jgi:hypothetical protein
VVEGHHGAVAVKNGPEKGSTFIITLPIPNGVSAGNGPRNAGQKKFFAAGQNGSARTVPSIR